MRITWANRSKRWNLVSNVSMTYNGFSESNTSDWLPYVWALPQNRWRLRRLHILKYATQLSCNFQHSHCTFVTILLRLLAGLVINLAVCIRTLFPQICILFLTCRTSTPEDAIFHRMESCKFLWGNPLHGNRTIFPLGLLASRTSRLIFSHSAAQKISEKDPAVSILHAYSYRVGNCNSLL